MESKVHLVLLGDAIFDNARCVAPQPDVLSQVRGELGPNAKETLLAVDGSVVGMVSSQVRQIPVDATHLAVSVGASDALAYASILEGSGSNVAKALAQFAPAQASFAPTHHAMLEAVKARGLPVAVATIPDGNFQRSPVVAHALSLFNDAVTRNAFSLGLDLVDLRLILDEPADYANQIEPSRQGGGKIAQALAKFVRSEKDGDSRSRVFC